MERGEIRGLRQFDLRRERRGRDHRHDGGSTKAIESNQRAVRIMTAGHGAIHHAGHVVPAIHVMHRRRGSSDDGARNFTLAGCAAGGLIR